MARTEASRVLSNEGASVDRLHSLCEKDAMDFSSGAWHLWVVSGLILGALELKLSGYVDALVQRGRVRRSAAGDDGRLVQRAARGVQRSLGSAAARFADAVPPVLHSRCDLGEAWRRGDAEQRRGGRRADPGRWLRHVRIDGELWTARSLDGAITEGERVRIENLEGLKLTVRRKQPALLPTLTEEEMR